MIRKKFGIILILCLIVFSFLMYYGYNKANMYNYKKVKVLKIGGLLPEKEIKSKRDIYKVLSLINNVEIIKTNVEPRRGIGISIDITYSENSNLKNESFSFLGNTMSYYAIDNQGRILNKSNNDFVDITGRWYEKYKKWYYFKPTVWYKINANISDDLRKVYDNN